MAENELDPTKLSFSQRYGYEPLPQQLKLGELSREARTRFWNILYWYIKDTAYKVGSYWKLQGVWADIMRSAHVFLFDDLLDEWEPSSRIFIESYKPFFHSSPFNEIFDLLEFLMRHRKCPPPFINDISAVFPEFHLAYALDKETCTIYQSPTRQEGEAIIEALQQLRNAGLIGAQQHLAKAAKCINSGDWADGVRESIHAVESVARQVAPGDAKTLGPALKKLEDKGVLQHRALREAFDKLYGYTCDEQGIRHALLGQGAPNVGLDEAVFMLGACASFASYLCRKQQALPGQGEGGA